MDDFTYILNTKLPNGVVHQHDAVLHSNPNVPVHPAAFLGPVLETFILLVGGGRNKESQQGKTDGAFTQATDADSTRCSTRGRVRRIRFVRKPASDLHVFTMQFVGNQRQLGVSQ